MTNTFDFKSSSYMTKKIILYFLIFSSLLTMGFGCKKPSKKITEKMKPINLIYWRVWDGQDDFSEIIGKYKQQHPFVNIQYVKLRYEEYEDALIDAFATDRGPDIYSIHNTWVKKYQSKGLISPMPANITMAYPIVKGSLKKEVVPELRTSKSLSLNQIRNNFIDPIFKDVVINGSEVYGLPLAIDTLALYYNKDLFNNAGITSPPEYWNKEFQQDVKKLTKQNNKGQIVQSGVALGGSHNIDRSTDILSVLMMQNGTEMMSDQGVVTFNSIPLSLKNKNYNPGYDALRFYTDFANPAKEVYSWNNDQENSIDLFINNKLAMMFSYSYMQHQIRAKAPKLNFAIAPLPQIEGNATKVNFANYWVESVSSKILTNPANIAKGRAYTQQKYDTAWHFIQFATNKDNVVSYLKKTKKPTALKSLIETQLDDQDLQIFAQQILTSKSWYRGNNANAAEKSLKEMIDKINSGQASIGDGLNLGAQKVQQTIN